MGVVAVFSYELAAATKNFTDEQISFHTVTNYSTLIDVAKQNGDITDADLASLKQWRADPAKWLAKG
jgi:orotate phosphoribosyltransferase